MSSPLTMTTEDADHLRLLSIGHYVLAGLQALWGCFPVVHLVMGFFMLAAPLTTQGKDAFPMAFMGGFFVVFAAVWMLSSWTLSACMVVAGRNLVRRRRRTFCMVVAGVEAALCMPLGTVLGVFTLIVLSRPAVRDAFSGGAEVLARR